MGFLPRSHGQKRHFPDDSLFPRSMSRGLADAKFHLPGSFPGGIYPHTWHHHPFLKSPNSLSLLFSAFSSLSLEGNGLMEDIQKLMEDIQKTRETSDGLESRHMGCTSSSNSRSEPQGLLWNGSLGQEGSPGTGQLSSREGTGNSQPWEENPGKLMALSSQGFEGPPCQGPTSLRDQPGMDTQESPGNWVDPGSAPHQGRRSHSTELRLPWHRGAHAQSWCGIGPGTIPLDLHWRRRTFNQN